MCRSAAQGGRRCKGRSGGGHSAPTTAPTGQWEPGSSAEPGTWQELAAAQDARVFAATRERMEAEKAITARHAAIWAARPEGAS